MTTRAQILNAFTPNNEIEDPHSFAGRKDLVFDLTDSLMIKGSCPVIYGERGLGKTSLALQIARIALGDDELLVNLRGKGRVINAEDAFIPLWVSCSKEIRTKNVLLQRIINTAETHESLGSLMHQKLKSTVDTHKFKLPFYELETKREYEKKGISFSRLDIEEKLIKIIDQIIADGAPGVLFILDELDRVSRTDGLGDFIKNVSSEKVKFLLVGVAQDISSLIADHESVGRSLHPFRVDPMGHAELKEIVEKTLSALRKENLSFVFSGEALAKLVDVSGGFPWFVHCFGQEALLFAYDNGRQLVTYADVVLSVERLAGTRFAQQYSDLYRKAVLDSPNREVVLRLFAKWPDYDVPVSEIYRLAKEIGVSNPSTSKTDLLKVKYGEVLVSPPSHKQGLVRFRNAVFKRYISVRDSIFENIREKVDTVWKEER